MISNYFNVITKRLTTQDFHLIVMLQSAGADKPIKAKGKLEIVSSTEFSDAIFRKVTNRLLANYFIDSVVDGKAHSYYLTEYGLLVHEHILKNEGVTN